MGLRAAMHLVAAAVARRVNEGKSLRVVVLGHEVVYVAPLEQQERGKTEAPEESATPRTDSPTC